MDADSFDQRSQRIHRQKPVLHAQHSLSHKSRKLENKDTKDSVCNSHTGCPTGAFLRCILQLNSFLCNWGVSL